jgi:hypothetical protein
MLILFDSIKRRATSALCSTPDVGEKVIYYFDNMTHSFISAYDSEFPLDIVIQQYDNPATEVKRHLVVSCIIVS